MTFADKDLHSCTSVVVARQFGYRFRETAPTIPAVPPQFLPYHRLVTSKDPCRIDDFMPLIELEMDLDDEQPLSDPIERWLEASRQRIQLFWDQFPQKPLAQYIECDFEWVTRGLQYCVDQQLIDGKLFVEWGCGFGVVTGVASILGLDAIGIEAEEFLCDEGKKLLNVNSIEAELWCGNFLPSGSAKLSMDDDPNVSLTHTCESAYSTNQMTLDDFAIVYVYPWPGEEHFLKSVFNRYARKDALLLLYRGPYHVELYRKQ